MSALDFQAIANTAAGFMLWSKGYRPYGQATVEAIDEGRIEGHDAQNRFLLFKKKGTWNYKLLPPKSKEPFDHRAIIDRVLQWNGLPIGVEYLPGQVRFPGKSYSKKLRSAYGHIRGYRGADKEALDIYLHPGLLNDQPEGSNELWAVDQLSMEDGSFDEIKLMAGYASEYDAMQAYLQEMPSELFGGIRSMSLQDLEQYRKPQKPGEVVADEDEFFVQFSEAEPVISPDVLGILQELLSKEANAVLTVFNVFFDPDTDTFQGRARQRISANKSQYYGFRISPDQMVYKLVNPDEMVNFAATDAGWVEIVEFAAKSGRNLNCKAGNVQCGGKCQSGKMNCYHGMTPAQKKAAQAAASKAKGATATATATPAAAPSPSPAATPKAAGTTKKAKAAATPVPTPAPDAAPVKLNKTELDKSRADLVKRFGQKDVEAAEKNVQRVLNEADVFIRVKQSSTLELILGDRFKTAHELDRTQHDIPHLKDDYLTARARVEAKSLGYAEKGTAPGDRPIYAYVGNGKDLSGASHTNVATAYGSIAVKLKPEVKDRTTFTGADSFKSGIASELKNDGPPPPPNAASLVGTTRHGYDRDNLPKHYPGYYKSDAGDGTQLRAAAKAKDIDELAPKLASTGNAYVEAQVHGRVTAKDIAEIHFTPSGISDRPTPAIAKFAKDNGVDLFVGGKKLSAQELDSISNPPADKRTQRVKDLADALKKGDIDSIVKLTEDVADSADKIALSPGERDKTLKLLRQEAGYSELPKVGTAQDVTDAWKNGGVLMVRGDRNAGTTTGADILKQFQSGDFHTGNGIYGNGTYVGHAGKFVKGKYVGYDAATATADAKRAVADVAKNNYMSSTTTNTRMALEPGSVVVKQSTLMAERNKLSTTIDKWANNERDKLTAGAKTQTAQDVQNYQKKVQSVRSSIDDSKAATVTKTQKDRLEVEFPTKKGKSIKATVEQSDYFGMATDFTVRDSNGRSITIQQTSKKMTKATLRQIADFVAERDALSSLKLTKPPVIGRLNDPTAQAKVSAFDSRVQRIRETLGLDKGTDRGSIERLAILRGIDAIALDQSYEPNTFMNLLNRSKVIVQQDPLSWSQASTTGAL